MPIIKFDNSTLLAIFEHYSKGLSYTEISKRLGISRMTLHRWIKKYDLKEKLENARHDYMSGRIESALLDLAIGATSSNTTINKDAQGDIVSTTENIRKDAPNYKAAQILARKYNITFSDTSENTSKPPSISMHIDIPAMNTRELRELNSNTNPLGDIELTSDAYEYATDIPSTSEDSNNSKDLAISRPPSKDPVDE